MKNKTESKVTPHTPTPWHTDGNGILGPDMEGTLGVISSGKGAFQDNINAAFIVKAVNSYESLRNSQDELVTMLKEEHEGYINEQYGEKSFKHKEKPCDVCEAIAKAEGKGA